MALAGHTSNAADLDGLNIMVVEDDYFVAHELARVLREHRAQVLGPVPDVARSRALLFGGAPDCVLLDINLRGEMAFDLAAELIGRGIPTIFTTGYDPSIVPASLRRAPCLQKPIEKHDLVGMVRSQTRATGAGA